MGLPSLTRRRFIKTAAIGTGVLAAGSVLTGCAPADFLHGVASGDPLEDRVVIWTRVTRQCRARDGEMGGGDR